MTEIDFYTHVDSKLAVACKVSAKAVEQGLKVWVHSPDAHTTADFDRLLWTQNALGFVPHCRAADPLAPETPVIVEHESVEPRHQDVLINLHGDTPPFFSRFQRLVEIVSTDPADSDKARERWRFYKNRGYEIRSHNLAKGRS
jgi:DNA polymerase-3 subunit chi